MVLLGLTVTFSGPLLRQAEAADDSARALANLLDPVGTIVVPDGGVGDDSGETTFRAAGVPVVAPFAAAYWEPVPALDGLPLPFTSALAALPDPALPQHLPGQTPWLPPTAGRRHAWLQLLLI
jgi:hypothetical protein